MSWLGENWTCSPMNIPIAWLYNEAYCDFFFEISTILGQGGIRSAPVPRRSEKVWAENCPSSTVTRAVVVLVDRQIEGGVLR